MIQLRGPYNVLLIVAATAVAQLTNAQATRLPSTEPVAFTAGGSGAPAGAMTTTEYEMLLQPASVCNEGTVPPPDSEPLPPGIPVEATASSLEELLQIALASNPVVAQADAHVQALRGQWVQVGLPPNPSAGYTSSEIGDDGRAGQQGGFIGQEFITGGKLRLNRVVVAQEIQQAEQRLAAVQLRVQTDVRQAFYAALIAQRRIELAEELLRVGSQATEASEELLRAEEIPQAGLLQTQIEQQNFVILSQTARNDQFAAWRRMSAVTGRDLAPRPLRGDVSNLPSMLDWDHQLHRVTSNSPEVSAAYSALQRAQAALERARAEPIPDLSTQASVQYDNATGNTIAGVQMGIPLPIWNRNQGGIRQAQAEIAEARRNADRVELDLKRRLATAYQQYATARAQAETYTTQILPKSQQTYELVQRGYRLGELGYLDLLTAQRTFAQTNLAYLDALTTLWTSWNEIDGLLLSDSLSVSPQ